MCYSIYGLYARQEFLIVPANFLLTAQQQYAIVYTVLNLVLKAGSFANFSLLFYLSDVFTVNNNILIFILFYCQNIYIK